MRQNNFSKYNDGVVSVYREKERRTDFSAKQNVSTLDNMDFIVKLAFEECAKREQDMDFAEQSGFSLTAKVKTRYVKGVDNKCKAVIDGYLYDVSHLDRDRRNGELYFYLEGVKQLDS